MAQISAAQVTLVWTVLAAIAGSGGCGEPLKSQAPIGGKSATNSANAIADSPAPPQYINAAIPGNSPVQGLSEPLSTDWFEDVTARSGIAFAYDEGRRAAHYTLLEVNGGGVAMLDYDQDGDLDLCFAAGGTLSKAPPAVSGFPCRLFRNDGDWKFADVGETAGLNVPTPYGHGLAVGDYNRDGYPDILLAGYQGTLLFQNQRDGTFADVTAAAGLACPETWNMSAAWADIDRDGWLDLYVVTYANWDIATEPICAMERDGHFERDCCPPQRFTGERDRVFRNRQDGTFEEVSDQCGLEPGKRGMGIVAADFDEDGWIDFYITNDVQENELYFGRPKLPFESSAELSGVAYSPKGERQGSMGVDAGDFNGDGQLDLFYTNFSQEDVSLLSRIGPRLFADVTAETGLLGASRRWVGWATGFVDFDHDDWLDLFICYGDVYYSRGTYFQPCQLFKNEHGQRYEQVSARGGPYFSVPHAARGAAVGDLDNDGALDLVIVHQGDPVTLLRNRLPCPAWVRVELRGTTSNPDGVGAKLEFRQGERTLYRWVRGGGSYLSHSDARVLFPLAEGEQPFEITVTWPAGHVERFSNLAHNQTHVLREKSGDAR